MPFQFVLVVVSFKSLLGALVFGCGGAGMFVMESGNG